MGWSGLLAAGAVRATAAGRIAVRRRITAAVAVVVSHVVDPFYFEGGCVWKSGAASQLRGSIRGRSLLLAAMPILGVVRIALVRVVIAIGLGSIGHVGLLSIDGG